MAGSRLDLHHAPYNLYGVKYIGLVSLSPKQPGFGQPNLDLSCAPYVLYGVKYIDPVSLPASEHNSTVVFWGSYIGPVILMLQ